MASVFEKHVFVCTQQKPDGVPACSETGGPEIRELIEAEIAKSGLAGKVLVSGCGCIGLCERGPNAVVYPEGVWYQGLKPEDVPVIVREHLAGGKPVAALQALAPEAVREEVQAHKAKVRKMMEVRTKVGALPDDFNNLVRGFMPSRVILTAIELDLFTAVGNGATASEASARAGTDPRATESLLNALAGLKLLNKRESRYYRGAWAEQMLHDKAPHDWRGALMHQVSLWRRWSTLTQAVHTGGPVEQPEIAERGQQWIESFIAAMHRNAVVRAPQVVAALPLDGVRNILDLGGGSGAYSTQFARALPDASITVFDLPEVTPLTRRYVDATELGKRIKTVNGDLRKDSYGAGFDLVFASAICHMNGPDENIDMFRRAFSALNAAGKMVIQDFILCNDKTRPVTGALFALNMLVGTPHGSTYSEAEYEAWMKQAGFGKIQTIHLPGPTALMVAMKG